MTEHIHIEVATISKWLRTKEGKKHATEFFNMPVEKIERQIKEMQERGQEIIPYSDCDNYDIKTGCKGHNDEKKGDKNAY